MTGQIINIKKHFNTLQKPPTKMYTSQYIREKLQEMEILKGTFKQQQQNVQKLNQFIDIFENIKTILSDPNKLSNAINY